MKVTLYHISNQCDSEVRSHYHYDFYICYKVMFMSSFFMLVSLRMAVQKNLTHVVSTVKKKNSLSVQLC
jgi:hypothetical protein